MGTILMNIGNINMLLSNTAEYPVYIKMTYNLQQSE